MNRHILLIKFRSDATHTSIEQLRTCFIALPQKIDGIESVEWGLNNSPEQNNRGFSDCVIISFTDDKSRDLYLPHPEHGVLKEVFRPLLKDIIVFDYTI